MNHAIEILMKEHRTIEEVLAALEGLADEAARGAPVDRAAVARFARFFREFADRCHHGKEENILFATLVERGMPSETGPIAVMLEEHRMGRVLVGALAALGDGAGEMRPDERTHFHTSAKEYISLLRVHIQKEDQILYPMAVRFLPAGILEDLARRFEAFERDEIGPGKHEAIHREVQDLLDRRTTGCPACGGHEEASGAGAPGPSSA